MSWNSFNPTRDWSIIETKQLLKPPQYVTKPSHTRLYTVYEPLRFFLLLSANYQFVTTARRSRARHLEWPVRANRAMLGNHHW